MAIKIKYKNFRLITLLAVLLLVGIFWNSPSSQFIRQVYSTSGEPVPIGDYFLGYPTMAVTLDEAVLETDEAQSCSLGVTRYATMSCGLYEAESVITWSADAEYSASEEQRETGFFETVAFEDEFDSTYHEARISEISVVRENWNNIFTRLEVYEVETGHMICSEWYTTHGKGDCEGQDIDYGITYRVELYGKPDLDETWIRIKGKKQVLKWGDPDIGGDPITIPETVGCKTPSWKEAVLKSIEDMGSIPLDEKDSAVSMSLGDKRKYPLYVRDEGKQIISPLVWETDSGTKYPAKCNFDEEVWYGYRKVSEEPNCFYMSDSGLEFDPEIKSGEKFCCGPDDCTEEGTVCRNGKCVEGDESTVQCLINDHCINDRYFWDSNGEAWESTSYCDFSTNRCVTDKESISCVPDQVYNEGTCCVSDDKGGFVLINDPKICAEEIIDTRPCRGTLGADACCLDSQDKYTIQTCGGELQCCEGEKGSGIGICKESCQTKLPGKGILGAFFNNIQEAIKSLFGLKGLASENLVSGLITTVALILIGLMVLKSLIPSINFPFRGGGRGGGGDVWVQVPPGGFR